MIELTEKFRSRRSVAQRCSAKEVFLEISQNSQENTCARVSIFLEQVLSCEFCEISMDIFSYKTPLVAASDNICLRGS